MSDDPANPVPSAPELHGLDPRELFARGLQAVKPPATKNAWVPPSPAELARLLPQYQIESLIGVGGMGAVYKGAQPALDRPVAIKLLPAEIAADKQFISRFQREARILAKLHHPGIVAVYDFGQTSEGHLYFVMEYVDGTDLRQILKGPGLAPEQALELIVQICEALQAAHQQGIIHRDIKPENNLITKDGRVKLADFGLARPFEGENASGITMTNMIMGTPDYMSPEQRIGQGDHRSDIFALGVMLYEMLTGKCPHGAFIPPSRKVQVDVRIDEVVLKAVQEEPNLRYQQVSEMKTDVDHIRTTTTIRSATVPKPDAKAPARRRAPLILGAVIFILLMAAACLFIWIKYAQESHANPNVTGENAAAATPAPTATPAAPAAIPIPSAPVAPSATPQSAKTMEQATATPVPGIAKEEKQSTEANAGSPPSFSLHVMPPYAPVTPPGAPYRIEAAADDILKLFAVNNQADLINVKFSISNIAGGRTDWGTSGSKNCEQGLRVLLAVIYKKGNSPVTFDLSTSWTPCSVVKPPSQQVVNKMPVNPNSSLNGTSFHPFMPTQQLYPGSRPETASPNGDATALNPVRHHGKPPYPSFVPPESPYHIEASDRNDLLEVYAVNDHTGVINVKFTFSNLVGGHTDWNLNGAKNCDSNSRVLLAVIYKNAISPITYDLITGWTKGAVPEPTPEGKVYKLPFMQPAQSANSPQPKPQQVSAETRAEIKRKLVSIVANPDSFKSTQVSLTCFVGSIAYYNQGNFGPIKTVSVDRLMGRLQEDPNSFSPSLTLWGDFSDLPADQRELTIASDKQLVVIEGQVSMGSRGVTIHVSSIKSANPQSF